MPPPEAPPGCGHCRGVAVLTCGRCSSVRYCSKECQKKHWKTHKLQCQPYKETQQLQLHQLQQQESGTCSTCSSTAACTCNNCRKPYYCNSSCQQQNWQQHQKHCYPFRVEESEELGRYAVATRDLKADEVIMKEEPLVLSPLEPRNLLCLGCYREIDASYRCRRCRWPLCGAACELSEDHQPECKVWRAAARPPPSATDLQQYLLIYPIRCLALKADAAKYEKLLAFQCHRNEQKVSGNKLEIEKDILNILKKKIKIRYCSSEKGDSLDNFVERVMTIIDVNGFDISLEDTDIMGLFPAAAFMEHSCSPNTKHKFTVKHHMVLQAAVDIPQGEHVSTCYTKVLLGTMARRKDLLENKYFLCSCKRCQDPTEYETFFSALKCHNCTDGYILPTNSLDADSDWICKSCQSTVGSREADFRCRSLGNDVDKILACPDEVALEKLLADSVATKAHYNHFHLFQARHTLMQICGRGTSASRRQETFLRKEKLCRELLDICSIFDPSHARLAPYTGVALYEYHNAIMCQVIRFASPDHSDHRKFEEGIETAKTLLLKCAQILKDEPENAPEGKLRLIAQKKIYELGILASKGNKGH